MGRPIDAKTMTALTRKLTKFRALTWPEKRLLLTAMLQLPLFWMGLRLLGFQPFQAWLDGAQARRSVTSQPPLSLAEMIAMGTLVNIAARYAPGPATCLTRSLLLRWLLRRRGTPTDLRIGVQLNQGRLDAHAWVEADGIPINDTPDVAQRFAPFAQPLSPESFT
jgi:hypothetical protein